MSLRPDPDEAAQKLRDGIAVVSELFDPIGDAGRIEAEARDALLCSDEAAFEALEKEIAAIARTQRLLGVLLQQAIEARGNDNPARVLEAAAAIRRVAEREFERASGEGGGAG